MNLDSLLSPEGAIARRLVGFEPRPQQVEMASAVQSAFEARGQLLVEAGTGVGKSFAYLLPAIERIVSRGERIVISTHTINLQEQLIEKDIPLLNAVIPDEFSAVLVKGRGNYVSLRRLKLASEKQDRLFVDSAARDTLHTIEDWAYTTRDGSVATLPQLPRPEVWDYAQSDAHNCMGRKCPNYDKCFYQSARRRMENGDLLICNHALFFADLALRMQGVGFLPPYDHVILDEAHTVEDVAAEHFGISLSESRVAHLLRLLYNPRKRKGFLATLRLKDDSTELLDQTVHLVLDSHDAMREQFEALDRWLSRSGSSNGRMSQPNEVDNALTGPMKELAHRLKLLKEKAKSEADQYELNSYAQRAMDIALHAEMLIEQQIDGCVYWVETSKRQSVRTSKFGPRITMKCVAIEVGPILREKLFNGKQSVVMTSATLATGPENFAHIVDRLGCDDASTLQLGSPFDFARQMRVYVDQTMPEPSVPKYVDELVPHILNHIRATDGGAFILFTSFVMLNRVADELKPLLEDEGYPVLVQGADGPPGLLLKRFREDERSILFGTASFWQGVDVRGRGLRNVIITRLPFDVPDQPLIEARHERIRERGGTPFIHDQVPRAIIRFKQGIGRLIRSHSDTGRIVILDPRVVTKRYGRMFLDALPDGATVEMVDDEDALEA